MTSKNDTEASITLVIFELDGGRTTEQLTPEQFEQRRRDVEEKMRLDTVDMIRKNRSLGGSGCAISLIALLLVFLLIALSKLP